MGERTVVGLCGDLWFDENVMKIKSLSPDVIFWPVYTDFNCNEWNESMKYEYAEQAGKVGGKVLYVNSYCKDRDGDEIARGGSVFFHDGVIIKEIPSGKEDVLNNITDFEETKEEQKETLYENALKIEKNK